METSLRTGQAELRLVSDDDDWCEARLVIREETFVLGADARPMVVSKLRAALASPDVEGERPLAWGRRVRWILTLSERHGSVYVAKTDAGVALLFQDASARLLATVELSSDDVESWLESLDG